MEEENVEFRTLIKRRGAIKAKQTLFKKRFDVIKNEIADQSSLSEVPKEIILELQSRLENLNKIFNDYDEIQNSIEIAEERSDQPRLLPQNLQNLLDKYQEYKQKTLQGDHGKTVQFYMMYVTFIDYHLTLSEIIRTGSFCVFTSVLPKIANLFFAFSQQNYSRYLVKYHDNLLKVDQSHLGLKEQLQLGTFGVKRTDKPYSRQPIDLTLEQTINADAVNKLTGVSHTTNSISARQRWCKSHTLRSTIISHTMEQAGLRKRQDITADLQKSRINKNSQQLLNFTDNIKQNINPFAADLDKNRLFDILTGQTVQENIESFLHG
nr:unnamed protein product [Callosobruchus chinensis]